MARGKASRRLVLRSKVVGLPRWRVGHGGSGRIGLVAVTSSGWARVLAVDEKSQSSPWNKCFGNVISAAAQEVRWWTGDRLHGSLEPVTGRGDAGEPARDWQWDVALSFAVAQRSYVEQVSECLKAWGVRCFYDADEQLDLWGRHLAEELPLVFGTLTGAVVVFISREYAERDWTRLERRAAINEAVSRRREFVLPARTDDTSLPGLISGMVTIDLRGKEAHDFARMLYEKLLRLGIVRAEVEGSADDALRPAIWNVPGRLASFTGRSEVLNKVEKTLLAPNSTSLTALHGLGGVGKTQLAIEYAHRHASRYTLVWWVDAAQSSVINEHIARLAPRIGLEASGSVVEDANNVIDHLRRRRKWLLIFDGVERPSDVRQWIPSGSGDILVTSRHPGWGALGNRLEIEVFSETEAIALIKRRVQLIEQDAAISFVREMGCLPLALEQAASYLEETGVASSTYLRRLRVNRSLMIGKGIDLVYGGNVASVWMISLERLRIQSPLAVELLSACACGASEAIPVDLLRHHPQLAGGSGAVGPSLELDDALGAAMSYSLVRRREDSIQLHKLVQDVIAQNLGEDEREAANATLREMLLAASPPDPENPKYWSAWAALVPHLLSSTSMHPKDSGVDIGGKARSLLLKTAAYLTARSDHQAAYEFMTRLTSEFVSSVGDRHPDSLRCANALAADLAHIGRFEEACELASDVLGKMREVLGEKHPESLQAANNLAVRLGETGNYSDAETLAEWTWRQRCELLGERHPDTLSSANNLVLRLSGIGDHEAARELGEATLSRRREVIGPDHPATLRSAFNLAVELRWTRDAYQALSLLQDTLDRQVRVLGRDHPNTLTTAGVLIQELTDQSPSESVAVLAADTYPRLRRVFGDDHPQTISLREILPMLEM